MKRSDCAEDPAAWPLRCGGMPMTNRCGGCPDCIRIVAPGDRLAPPLGTGLEGAALIEAQREAGRR